MNIIESISIAFNSVKSNKLRTLLTLLSISIGVFAIIGAGSLVTSINVAVETEMSALGDNAFSIRRMPHVQMGNSDAYRDRKPIGYTQYRELKQKLTSAEFISGYSHSSGNTINYGTKETDPDVDLLGVDENIFYITTMTLSAGRPFVESDIRFSRNVAIIGNDILVKIFSNENPINKQIKIGNQEFTVIGVLEVKGALMGRSQDNRVLIPLTQFLRYYTDYWNESLDISIKAQDAESMNYVMDEAIGMMRSLRNLKPWDKNNFEVETNEMLKEQFSSITGYLSWFGAFCGIWALIAAGVGITNIMLISVKERTREIGIRKAVGAKRSWILYQFLIESVTLCQLGGLIGIVIGSLAGAGLGSLIGIKLTLPIFWIVLSLVFCTMLGLGAGAYPAWKAANLNPIDALRYE